MHTWPLDVADDATRGIIHEFDADLGDTTARAWSSVSAVGMDNRTSRRTGTAQNTGDLDELDGLLSGIHDGRWMEADGGRVEKKE